MPITIAIDGPSGAGKSTVAKAIARSLNYIYVDTGAIYRALAWISIKNNINDNDEIALRDIILNNFNIQFCIYNNIHSIYLNNQDITNKIRVPHISMLASKISALRTVRNELLYLQRKLSEQNNAVLEGRDIATVVCPNAKIKIYLDADLKIRAKRRFNELIKKNSSISYENILNDMCIRDKQDIQRIQAPLKPALDSIILDCTNLNITQVVEKILSIVNLKIY